MDKPSQGQAAQVGQRLAKGYRVFCILVVNTAILFVLIVVVLNVWFPQERFFWTMNSPSGKTISERFDPTHYYFVTPQEVQGIFDDFDNFGLSGQWQSDQWTGLTNRPYHGAYLNVDADGLRATTDPAAEAAGKTPFSVWAFGGSTMFGWGLPDAYTIPSQLQAELQRRLPDRQVRVVNYGVPSFTSSQEAARFIAAVRDSQGRPDVAVFLDGLNEFKEEVDRPDQFPANLQAHNAFEESLSRLAAPAPWLDVAPDFPLFRAGYALGLIKASSFRDDNLPLSGDRVETVLERYTANRQIIQAAAASFDIRTVFLVQPVPEWMKKNRRDIQNDVYRQFVTAVDAGHDPNTYDITDALADLDPDTAMTVEPLGTHYTDAATQLLVKKIADIVIAASQPG